MCHTGDEEVSSGLSEHSSDRIPMLSGNPEPAPLGEVAGGDDDSSELLTPSASESELINGKPITSQHTTNGVKNVGMLTIEL